MLVNIVYKNLWSLYPTVTVWNLALIDLAKQKLHIKYGFDSDIPISYPWGGAFFFFTPDYNLNNFGSGSLNEAQHAKYQRRGPSSFTQEFLCVCFSLYESRYKKWTSGRSHFFSLRL